MLLKILNYFFVGLGVIFFAILLLTSYIFIADPFNLRPLWEMMRASEMPALPGTTTDATESAVPAPAANPTLSPAQTQALEAVGLDPASVPSSITPEQEACFVAALGAARVAEIKAGDTPTPQEFFAARHCLE